MFPQGRAGLLLTSAYQDLPTYLVVRPVYLSGFKPQLITGRMVPFRYASMSCALNLEQHPTAPGGCGVDAPRPILSCCRIKEIVG